MIAPNIEFSQRSKNRLRMRAYLNKNTREPRGERELYWQKLLKDFDSELSLRWSYPFRQYLILYDHHGQISVIRTFKPDESFWCAFKNIKHNSTMNLRKLKQMRADFEEETEKKIDHDIDECAEEFAKELHHCTRGRVINDGVKDNDY